MATISDDLALALNNMSPAAQNAQIGTRLQEALAGELPSGSISTAELADSSVTSAKIGAGEVEESDINAGAVTADKIASGAVSTAKLAANAVTLAKIAAGTIVGVATEDAKTTSREENIAGLSSALALANALKATINTHYADQGGGGEEHIAADTAIASDDATTIATLVTLVNEMKDSYVAHDDDAILAAAWVYHQAQGTERALASEVDVTNLQTSITMLNDLKAKLNLHMADAVAHTAGDTTAEATADAAYGTAILVSVSGVVATDDVVWGILDSGTGTVTGVSAAAGTGAITFTFSADPQNDAIINYAVFRTAT